MEADKKRQIEFDYAKTLAILFMVIIHVVEELSNVEVYETLPKGILENIIQFGAGPLAAPQFMLAMGVGVVFSRYHDPRSLFRRGVRLLLLGLLAGIVSTCLYYRIDIRNFYALYDDWLYKQTFFHFIFNACIIAVELSAFHFLCRHGSKCDGFASFTAST